jgi:hypothetical protein
VPDLSGVRTSAVEDAASLVDELAGARIGRTFNPYAEGRRAALRRERLARYLHARSDATLLLAGEALGYRGGRVSGVPFTSERQLTGSGPSEATATIVHRILGELGIAEDVLLWNVVPTHPGTVSSNRPPTRPEVDAGLAFLERLAPGRTVVAIGRVAAAATGAPYIRHPSHGGTSAFREGVGALLHSAVGGQRPPFFLRHEDLHRKAGRDPA